MYKAITLLCSYLIAITVSHCEEDMLEVTLDMTERYKRYIKMEHDAQNSIRKKFEEEGEHWSQNGHGSVVTTGLIRPTEKNPHVGGKYAQKTYRYKLDNTNDFFPFKINFFDPTTKRYVAANDDKTTFNLSRESYFDFQDRPGPGIRLGRSGTLILDIDEEHECAIVKFSNPEEVLFDAHTLSN